MTVDEYEVFKAYAGMQFATIGGFARRCMKSEIRRRIRDKYWERHASPDIKELAKKIATDTDGDEYVYFIMEGKYIKIGYTRDIKNRMNGIECDNPNDLTLLACFPGDRRTELALHEAFSHCRYRNEWFHAANDIFEFINAMREISDSVLKD